MNIAVVGSRNFSNKKLIEHILWDVFWEADGCDDTIYTLISGGAKGVDTWAEEYIKDIRIDYRFFPIVIHKPDWNKYGKSAGFIRNKLIINEADKVIAFWDGQSKGTKHSIDLAIKANKPINIYIR